MKQRFWWTTVVLLMTACGTTSTSHAKQELADPPGSDGQILGEAPQERTVPAQRNPENTSVRLLSSSKPTAAIAVGEYSLPSATEGNERAITKIQPHEITGKIAATLYVRDIPVLTFISSTGMAQSGKSATQSFKREDSVSPVTVVSYQPSQRLTVVTNGATGASAETDPQATDPDPVLRASFIAQKLNQLNQSQVPSEITVDWHGDIDESGDPLNERYLIKVNGEELVAIDSQTRLPDTTNDLAQDAIQVTNRLRRLIANAPPIAEIANRPQPKPPQTITPKYLQYQINGWASWYGPGFHGRLSASGEVFDQNALTAAHLHLPFGTRVRVTNLNNGLSVVVRINDRGPYIGGRIIDISAGAARSIGMMDSGVAPVRLDILDAPSNLSADR